MKKTNLHKLIIALIAGFITFILSVTGLLTSFDYMVTDSLYQRPVAVNNNIKIIAIDEKSMAELGPHKTWSREHYANLLNTLYEDSEYAPNVCIFDLIFQGNTDNKSDTALAMAAKNAGGIVCASNIVFKDAIEEDSNGNKYLNHFHTDLAEYPYEELMEYSTTGFANTINDSRDSVVRDFFPILSDGDRLVPSLALEAARVLQSKGITDINIPDTKHAESLMIRYSGKPGDYESISFVDVVNGRIPKEAFKNSIVLVGAYAPGMMDAYNVPTSNHSQMYGVEIHANILESITEGRFMERKSLIIPSLLYSLIIIVFMLLAQNISLLFSGILGIALIVIQIFTGLTLAGKHIYLPLFPFELCVILGFISVIVTHYLAEIMQRRRVLKAFRQYVSPEVVDAIAKRGNFELTLGGQKRDIAVLFVDIRGFTPLSEALEPEQVVEILNEYLTLTTTSIFNNWGTLDKFVGDATMAVFNSPFDLEDYVYKAVCAAYDIVAGSEEIRKKALELTNCEVGFGVGVNCGSAVVGNIGCDFRMDYTAIGDTVNTAARLEANAKAGQVLLSQSVIDTLGDRIKVNPVGEIPLKGKSIPLMVYELVDVIK